MAISLPITDTYVSNNKKILEIHFSSGEHIIVDNRSKIISIDGLFEPYENWLDVLKHVNNILKHEKHARSGRF